MSYLWFVRRMRRQLQDHGYTTAAKTYHLKDGTWVLTAWTPTNDAQARVEMQNGFDWLLAKLRGG